ncbi:MAG: T9SS type A sorting domain-containing protein [Ignavibacteria bacterium]|nr:T9SS type A sorting domain-containing protein [Ignavibacteria bacterium]
MKILLRILTIVICSAISLSAQTTWYISTVGSDANTGKSAATAFATVSQAFSVCACGDSIYILGGTYHQKINTYAVCPDNNRIVIQGDVSNRPLIIGDSTQTNKYAIGAHGTGFTFRHLELTSPYPNICDPSNMVVAGSGDNMSFIDVIIRNSGYDGMKTTSDCATSTWANNWKVIDCQVINNGLGCPAEIKNGDGIDFTECHDCEIIGTTISNNMGHQLQIKLEARNVKVEDCRIEGNLLIQIGLPGGSPQCDPTALNADSVFIRHNIIVAKGDTSEFIFKLADVSHLVIENNTIIKDSISSANLGFVAFGGFGGNSNFPNTPKSPVIIRNNIFANMSTTRFYAGPDTTYFDPFGITPTNVTDNYNLFYDVNGEYTKPVDGGTSSIVANPMFRDYPKSYELSTNSPCINAGDPVSPLDPDSSRSDIGAKYYRLSSAVPEYDTPSEHQFKLSYTPTTEILTITTGNQYQLTERLQLYTVIGVLMQEVPMSNTTYFNMAKFPKGLYFVRMNNNGFVGKFLKE